MTSSGLCCELSESAGEQIAATAPFARSWLVVEVPGTWPRDVSDGSGLEPAAREAVQSWLARTADSRLLLVRRPRRSPSGGRLAFVVCADEEERSIRRLELDSPDELARVDFERAGSVTGRPLVLVCGHGARDRCCALRGTAVYGALAAELAADDVWISSHQGGHRFAANVLLLPQGIQLGRISATEAAAVVGEALGGRVPLARYRGRAAYPPPVQAAERAVREATRLDALDDLRLTAVEGGRVSFRDRTGGEHVALVEHGIGPTVPASCGADPEPQPLLRARVL